MPKPNLGRGVLARYGNWYHDDDDFFTHCLILKNGECWLLGQGLSEAFVRAFKARTAKFRQLTKGGSYVDSGRLAAVKLRHQRIQLHHRCARPERQRDCRFR